MKVKVNNEKDFEPIELTITIESKEELNGLFARLDQTNGYVIGNSYKEDVKIDELRELYSVIRQYCEKRLI